MPTEGRAKPDRYWVLSRPGEPWSWNASKHCEGGSTAPLEVGTHTLRGLEDSVRIDRMGLAEFGLALGTPELDARMEALSGFPQAFVVIEGNFADLETVPARPGLSLLQSYADLLIRFPSVRTTFAGRHGRTYLGGLFARMVGR